MNSSRFLLLGFALAIVLGGVLLALPAASTGDPLSLVDALFMATSAVCVTGLSVLDIGTGCSRFGQAVLLVLIQVGGLGIMTLSSMLLIMLGQRVSLNRQDGVTQTYTSAHGDRFGTLLKRIFLATFTIELCGALALFSVESERQPGAAERPRLARGESGGRRIGLPVTGRTAHHQKKRQEPAAADRNRAAPG